MACSGRYQTAGWPPRTCRKVQGLWPATPGRSALASRARPAVLPPPGVDDAADELHRLLAPLQPECLMPMVDRNGRLVGVVALGGRQSEEPYSGEDIRLLAVVSLQSA